MLPAISTIRRRIIVHGIVQGVGFRPFVYGEALRHGLSGFVRNDSGGVTIEIEGKHAALELFERALRETPPPLARIDSIIAETIPPGGDVRFVIAISEVGQERNTLIAPDSATCDDCVRELFDPTDRRYRYPFINCTNCGPRFTIVQDIPYDRSKTTMQVFPMCPACQGEYDDPLDRRFHAQPNACATCGPQVRLCDTHGQLLDVADPVAAAAEQLAAGAILAIKGLGGYHLACDARNEAAVVRLRRQKQREARPFALMVADLVTANQLCQVTEAEARLIQSRRRPIVLLQQRPNCSIASGVAPGHTTLGAMLPYTPLHHLLLRAFAVARSTSANAGGPAALVLTSGNVSDEPIAYRDDDAHDRLMCIADGMLLHDREIHTRCDDSVIRASAGGEQIMRRARGFAPEPIQLAFASPVPVIACGGHLKNTFCLIKGDQAFVSHHIGDLQNLETLTSFRAAIEHMQRLFDIYPAAVAYDLHPEYLATKHALDLQVPTRIGVQHHHAHIASVLAEHGLGGPVIGVAADGTGYGTDGAVWGCEIMVADLLRFERLAHLAYVPMPGGDQAIRQPWRLAAVYLQQAFGDAFLSLDLPFVRELDQRTWRPLTQMIARRINSPSTSSLGRLFDAVAVLLGLCRDVLYEGQAAIELEMVAEEATQGYPFFIGAGELATLEVAPMIRAIVDDLQRGIPIPQIAGRFHCTVADLLTAACVKVRAETNLHVVALSGGVFQNRLLLEQLTATLESKEFQVYCNRQVPPNDGGLSFGQAAVAAARLHHADAPVRTPGTKETTPCV